MNSHGGHDRNGARGSNAVVGNNSRSGQGCTETHADPAAAGQTTQRPGETGTQPSSALGTSTDHGQHQREAHSCAAVVGPTPHRASPCPTPVQPAPGGAHPSPAAIEGPSTHTSPAAGEHYTDPGHNASVAQVALAWVGTHSPTGRTRLDAQKRNARRGTFPPPTASDAARPKELPPRVGTLTALRSKP